MGTAERYNRIVTTMLDYVDKTNTDQAETVMSVPVGAYTDRAQWEREMALIYKRLPILVGLTHELPKAGDYQATQILDKPLLITRQKDGSVRVMLNVCGHRGALLAADGCGNRSRFSCPYHSWTYANDGKLLGVSGERTFGDVDKSSRALTQLPCYERGGLIFAVLTPGLEVDFAQYLGGMIEDIAELDFANWHYSGKRAIHGANWKIAYDGYLEGYHFESAHPETINARTYSNIMEFDAHGPHLFIAFPQRSISKLREIPQDELWRHENDGFDFIRLLFPNVSIFVAPELTQIAQLIPGPTPSQNTTILYFLHRKAPADAEEAAQNEQMIDWIKGVVDAEDYQLGLKVQRGLESGAFKEVLFGRNERGNQFFHNWVNYYLADDPNHPVPIL
jgi:phenylpropionate dioxygenase-like ring-hydroxylating dioxygenase large terminal subunit